MAPGDVCHGPRCSLAGLRPAALEYRSCHWPVGSAGSPQCARPMGCCFFPVPRPLYVCTCVRCPGPLGSCSPVCPLGALLCWCGVLGHLAPVHRCARSVCCFAYAVSWATWVLFTGVPARCIALLVRCPGPLGSCSPMCPLGALLCVCGVLGHLAPVHRCPCLVCCLCVRCPGPLASCSPVCPLGVLFCLCGVPGHLAPVHRCARSMRCLCVRCPGPLGSCSPVCPLVVVCCVCGVLGHLAPVHRRVRLVRCFACAVSWATWLLFTGVPARCVVLLVWCPGHLGSCSLMCPLGALPVCAVSWASWLLFTGVPACRGVLRVRCPGPLGSCSPPCPLGALFCLCGVLGHLAPVHRCAPLVRCFVLCGALGHLAPVQRSAHPVCCVACAVCWATWLLFTGVPARRVVLRVRCPGPLGSCSLVFPLCVLSGVCGVLGHLPPVHWCARSVRCFACAVSWATWLLFTGVPAWCVACVCGVLGQLVPARRCARLVCCFACAVSWATWLLFTGVPARSVALRVRCPGPLGSCSQVCPLGVLFFLCGVLGQLARVHRFVRSVCCDACAVSWATWLLFTGVPARCVVLGVACAGRRCGALTRPSGR